MYMGLLLSLCIQKEIVPESDTKNSFTFSHEYRLESLPITMETLGP